MNPPHEEKTASGGRNIFIGRYLLNRREMLKARVYDSYGVHRMVYSLFERTRASGEQTHSGIQYADLGERKWMREILLLSDREPIIPEIGTLETRRLPDNYLDWQNWRFAITVNPAVRKSGSGQIEPVRGRYAIADWLIEKFAARGMEVDTATLEVRDVFADRFRKGNGIVTLEKATLEGWLAVTDHRLFREAFQNGIGRGRAFGCGMLRIIRAN